MACPVPHPARGEDGIAFADELEVIGGHASETWVRCRRCGTWLWLSTDIGSKFEYVAAVALDAAVAERALLRGEPDAAAELVATHRVPYGPVWTTASAMAEMFNAITRGATDAARAHALSQRAAGPLWVGAAKLFAAQARGRAKAPPAALAFAVDVRLPDTIAELHELGASLVVVPAARRELLRVEPAGVVRLPLAGEVSTLAVRSDAAVFAVATSDGTATMVLDAAGRATATAPSATSYAVSSLDDGWWLFVPQSGEADREADRGIELRRPDGTPRVRLPRRFTNGATWMPAPRRFADGWIVSNLIDDDGAVQALTLFDGGFATAAYTTEPLHGERAVTPIDDTSLWASVHDTMERWVRRGRSLERVQRFPLRSSWLIGGRMVTDLPGGEVIAYGPDGTRVWTWRRSTAGAAYGVATPAGVLLYDDDRAHLVTRDGAVVTTFAVEYPAVLAARSGTIYLKTGATLWVVRDDAHALDIDPRCALVTSCGDDALLAFDDGRFELVSRDGRRAGFTATGAPFSVVGTAGGPYVVEGDRLRVARFAAST